MSTHSVVVEIISGNDRKTITLDCSRSANALEVAQTLSHQMSDEEHKHGVKNNAEPEKVVLRDRHGTRLHPNRKIGKVSDLNGTHLIAELTGEGGVQRTDGRQHDKVKRSMGSTTRDNSQEFEEIDPAKSPKGACTRNTASSASPTKNKRRKVEREGTESTLDTPSSSLSPLTIDDSDNDQASQIQTKRKSRKRTKANEAHKVTHDLADSRQHEENQCRDCGGATEESPTVRLGLKLRHGGTESDQSPSRASLRLRRRTCLMCSDDTQHKSTSRERRRKTPNSKTDPVITKVTKRKQGAVGETGSPEKKGRGAGAMGLKEDHLSYSLRIIHLEDNVEGNLPSATKVPKKGGQSAKMSESAMTLYKKAEGAHEKKRVSVSGETKDTEIAQTDRVQKDRKYVETTFNKDLAEDNDDATIKTISRDSTDEPVDVDQKYVEIEEVQEPVKKEVGTADQHSKTAVGKEKAFVEKNTPVNEIERDSVDIADATREPVETSNRYVQTVNKDVDIRDATSTLVDTASNQSQSKFVDAKKSTNNTVDNDAKCSSTAIVKAKEQSPTKLTGIIKNPFAISANAGNSASARKSTITCEITITKRVSCTSGNKNLSKVIHIVPGKPVRDKAGGTSVSKLGTKANSKEDNNFLCVDADECEEHNSTPVADGDLQDFLKDTPSSPDGEDPVVANIGRNELKRSDLDTLEEGEWLNDCVINAYFFLLSEKSSLSIFTHSSFFFFSLFKRGYEGVKRWTKNVDLFEQDLIFIPIHNKSHWSLVVVHIKEGIIEYYNSSTLLDGYPRSMMHIRDYLKSEAKNRGKTEFCDISWEMYIVGEIPRQQNMDDCGLFICQYAKKLSLKQKVSFDIKKTINLRRQMLRELLRSEIEEH